MVQPRKLSCMTHVLCHTSFRPACNSRMMGSQCLKRDSRFSPFSTSFHICSRSVCTWLARRDGEQRPGAGRPAAAMHHNKRTTFLFASNSARSAATRGYQWCLPLRTTKPWGELIARIQRQRIHTLHLMQTPAACLLMLQFSSSRMPQRYMRITRRRWLSWLTTSWCDILGAPTIATQAAQDKASIGFRSRCGHEQRVGKSRTQAKAMLLGPRCPRASALYRRLRGSLLPCKCKRRLIRPLAVTEQDQQKSQSPVPLQPQLRGPADDPAAGPSWPLAKIALELRAGTLWSEVGCDWLCISHAAQHAKFA